MSDVSQGPGWWQASDGKWYPPEQQPGGAPAPQQPTGPPPGAPGGQPAQPGAPGHHGHHGPHGAGGNTVSASDAFNWGFKKFQENIGPIILAAVIIFAGVLVIQAIIWFGLIGSLSSSTSTYVDSNGMTRLETSGGGITLFLFGYGIAMLVLMVGSYLIQMAIIRATLMITNGEQVDLKRMFSTEQIGTFIGAALLVAVGTYIGAFLCVLPGLVFLFYSFFFGWFVLDKKLGAVDSIKASFQMVNQNMGTCVAFFVGCIIAYAIGLILCGIGLLVAIPVIVLSTGFVYKRLQGENVAA